MIKVAISFVRTLIIFVAVIFTMRVMGKRQLGELELSELVVTVMISDIAAQPLQDIGIPLLYGLVPVFTLLCSELIISALMLKSLRFRSLLCGRPSILVENGKIIQSEMKKNRFTIDELTEALRKKGVLDISTVKYAVLETNGTLSTVLYRKDSPATPTDMGVQAADTGYCYIVINDGRILEENLKLSGHDLSWLHKQLKRRDVTDPRTVYMMSVMGNGKIELTLKERDGK
jgi:uncharacterized membrane protein YcaP (DUF421 family)